MAKSADTFMYDTVESFYHRDPNTSGDYIDVTTESNRTLTLTSTHLIPTVDCELRKDMDAEQFDKLIHRSRFASRLRPGNCLYLNQRFASHRLAVERIVHVSD